MSKKNKILLGVAAAVVAVAILLAVSRPDLVKWVLGFGGAGVAAGKLSAERRRVADAQKRHRERTEARNLRTDDRNKERARDVDAAFADTLPPDVPPVDEEERAERLDSIPDPFG